MSAKIKIDPEFSQLIPATSAEEDAEFERAVLADGKIFEPLILWDHQNILLDGHRRNRLLTKNPKLKAPEPIVLKLESRQEAHDWIIHHQLSKRNVTPEQRRYLIGKLYLQNKPEAHRPNKSATVADLSAREIAAKEGVSERTVHNAASFAAAVDAVPEIKEEVLSGEVQATTADLETMAALPKRKRAKAAKRVKAKKAKSVKAAVKDVKQEILQANADEEAEPEAEPTAADLCEADNKAIESFCRQLVKFFEDNCPAVAWTKAEGRIDSALASVKAGCGTLRQAKSVVCPQCEEGEKDGKKCPYCKGHGYLPKLKADQIAGVK